MRTHGAWVVSLVLVLGCRALRNDYDRPDDIDAAPPGSPTMDGGAADESTRLEPPIVHAVAGVAVETMAGADAPGGADGAGGAARFDNPVGVALESNGGLLVAEYGGGRIRRLSPSGASTTLATGMVEPFGIIATDDAIFVQTDRDPSGEPEGGGTLWKLPLEGGTPQVVATALGRVRGLAQLFDGRIVLGDSEGAAVSVLDPSKADPKILAGGRVGLVDGRGPAARFRAPHGVAILPDGSMVVADRSNHAIRKMAVDGTVTLYAGDGKPGMKDDADRLAARFDGPIDVAADALGNVYVSDAGNKRIRRISANGAVETLAGDGTRGFADGAGGTARFSAQEQLEVTPDGKVVFVSDGSGRSGEQLPSHRIRRITL